MYRYESSQGQWDSNVQLCAENTEDVGICCWGGGRGGGAIETLYTGGEGYVRIGVRILCG